MELEKQKARFPFVDDVSRARDFFPPKSWNSQL